MQRSRGKCKLRQKYTSKIAFAYSCSPARVTCYSNLDRRFVTSALTAQDARARAHEHAHAIVRSGANTTMANPLAVGVPSESKPKRAKRSPAGTKKPQQSRAKGGASLYKDVVESIGCQGITYETVHQVCEGVRKAAIRDLQKHGQFKIYGLCNLKLKQIMGRPARTQKFYDRHTKSTTDKHIAARPPYKKVSGRVLGPLQNLFKGPCEDAPAPCAE